MSEVKDSNREDVAKSAMDHQHHAHMLRPDVDDALLRRNKALWAHSSWHGRFASGMPPGSGGGFDEELHRLRETNLLLSEECSALKEVLSTANLAASGECSRLREQVSTLFRENCSLKEHSAKVAIESKALKKQLATSNKENAVLRHRLSQFSQQLKSVAKTNTPTNAIANDYSCSVENADIDCGVVKSSIVDINSMTSGTAAQQPLEGSLEQISQQLLVHLQREKLELEQQYTQMVKIQNSPSNSGVCGDVDLLNLSISAENLDVVTTLMNQMDTCRSSSRLLVREATMQNRLLSALVEQLALTDTLQKVAKQQLGEPPPSALSSHEDFSKKDIQPKLLDVDDKVRSRDHAAAKSSSRTSLDELLDMYDNDEKQHAEDEMLQVNDEERIQKTLTPVDAASTVATLDNRVCPMCHAVFPISVPLHEFEAHVMEHFHGEDFEIIMHDADDDDQESDGTPLRGGYR